MERVDRHDKDAKEPLGPATPDKHRPAGDTPEVHDEVMAVDIPKDNPGRRAAEEEEAARGVAAHEDDAA